MDQCSPRLIYLASDPTTRKSSFRENPINPDGDNFFYCRHCKKIDGEQLIQCPECNRFFKGPKPYFRINYECDECG